MNHYLLRGVKSSSKWLTFIKESVDKKWPFVDYPLISNPHFCFLMAFDSHWKTHRFWGSWLHPPPQGDHVTWLPQSVRPIPQPLWLAEEEAWDQVRPPPPPPDKQTHSQSFWRDQGQRSPFFPFFLLGRTPGASRRTLGPMRSSSSMTTITPE